MYITQSILVLHKKYIYSFSWIHSNIGQHSIVTEVNARVNLYKC